MKFIINEYGGAVAYLAMAIGFIGILIAVLDTVSV